MVKRIPALGLLAAVILSACSPQPSPSGEGSELDPGASPLRPTVGTAELSVLMEGAGISNLRPLEDGRLYVVGWKHSGLPDHRFTFYHVLYDENADTATLLHQGKGTTDDPNAMRVAPQENGDIYVYMAGQALYHLAGGTRVEELDAEEQFSELTLNWPSGRMACVNSPKDLLISTGGRNGEVIHYARSDSADPYEFPYRPFFNDDGSRLLFGLARGTAMNYQGFYCHDADGSPLFAIEDLPPHYQETTALWYGEKVVVLQITDENDNGVDEILISLYGPSGVLEGRYAHELMMVYGHYQWQLYPNAPYLALCTQEIDYPERLNAGDYRVGYINLDTGEYTQVHQSPELMLLPTVTQDGKNLIWVEGGKIRSAPIQ